MAAELCNVQRRGLEQGRVHPGDGVLEAEGAERVKEALWDSEVHVVPGSARLAVAARKEEDLLRVSGRDGSGESALAGRESG